MYNLENKNNCGLSLFDDFSSMFSDILGRDMKTNIQDLDDKYVVTSSLAGVKKEDIKIDVLDDTLEISVTNNSETKDEKKNYILKEISSSSMKRSFYLEDMDTNNISAKLENGILTVTILKLKEVKPVQKKIAID